MVMTLIPARETLTVEFKSDPPAGLSDKTVVESVVGMTNAQGGVLYIGVDDDGGAGGVRSPKWSDPEKVTAFLAGQTVPPSWCAQRRFMLKTACPSRRCMCRRAAD